MVCRECKIKLPARAKFCLECGTPVAGDLKKDGPPAAAAASESSSRQLTAQPASYTPRHLADKILTSRAALAGERKHVSVLFADVKGSMELAEHADPEEWHRIMDRFFAILTDGVHRFEGTINQYTGDGVMALFGAPIAHEDHAQRCCHAALYLRDELRRYGDAVRISRGLNFSVRMGINSGEVVVGAIGDDLRMDYTALGHTVGLAARMEQIAEPGRVYLTEHSAALVSGFFALRDLGLSTLKGVSEPVRVFELEGAGPLRTRFEVARARGFSRFVGRVAEMDILENALATVTGGRASIASVVGDPGVGKSRLCYEFAERVRARHVAVFEAHCVAYGKMIPFLPVIELVRRLFAIGDRDNPALARQKIAGALVLLDDSLRAALPLMFDFLGVPDPQRPAKEASAEAQQRALFHVIKRVVQERGGSEPVIILIEDLHWMDAGSGAFLRQLLTWLVGTRILLLTNFRPEFHAQWLAEIANLQSEHPADKGLVAKLLDLLTPAKRAEDGEAVSAGEAKNERATGAAVPYVEIVLQPLGEAAARELLAELLGNDPSVAAVAGQILSRTGGNPFFIEEVVRTLAETRHFEGVKGAYRLVAPFDEIAIPPTVHAVLAARIDRLAEREKDVLEVAAITGKECSESLLRAVITDFARVQGHKPYEPTELAAALRMLVEADFLYERDGSPDAIYVFAHPLTQEVAYRTQLSERRSLLHAAAARAITALYPDAVDQRAAELAQHWEEAGDLLAAARCQQRAAWWVAGADAAGSAEHLRRARTLLGRLPRTEETARLQVDVEIDFLRVGPFVGMSTAEAQQAFRDAEALAVGLNDKRLLAELLSTYAYFCSYWGDVEEARRLARRAAKLAENVDDVALQINLAMDRSQLSLWDGNLRQGLGQIEAAAAMIQAHPIRPGLRAAVGLSWAPFAHAWRGLLLSFMGRLTEAQVDLDLALETARSGSSIEAIGLASSLRALAGWGTIDVAELEADARTALDIGERVGTPFLRTLARFALGGVCLLRGRWHEARAFLESGTVVSREGDGARVLGRSALEAMMLPVLGLTVAMDGSVHEAEILARTAVQLAQQRRTRLLEGVAQLCLAHVLLVQNATDNRPAIESAIAAAQACVANTGAISTRPLIHFTQAQLAARLGDTEAARRQLRKVHRLLKAMGAAKLAEQLVLALP